MDIICRDILNFWLDCWLGAVIAGSLCIVAGRGISHIFKRTNFSAILYFCDGMFFYYLLYVTLISRSIGSRREAELLPFVSINVWEAEFRFVIENVLLFIPFGFLVYMTCRAYGKKCNMKIILRASFLTSVSIEMLQFVFACGKSETDDVMTNVLGAAIGYLIARLKRT